VVLALHLWRSTVHVGPGSMAGGNGLMERLQWWLLLLSAVMFSMSGCATMREWRLTALRDWSEHPAHFASAHHMAFSMKRHETAASITEADTAAAAREDWWGRVVPRERATVVSASAPTPVDKRDPNDLPMPAPGRATDDIATSAPGRATDDIATPAAKRVAARKSGSREDRSSAQFGEMTGRWRGYWMANGVWGERRESDAEMLFVQDGNKGTGHMRLGDTVAAVGVPEVVRHLGALGTPMSIRISRGGEVLARYENGPAVLVRFTRVGDRIYGRIDNSPSFLLVLDRQ
jgi:hypothetical protein